MNIYIHIEISVRELDSKLLATLSASRGHEVIISSMPEIMSGIKSGVLLPGVLHTKSITPSKKIDRHKVAIDKGFKITSIDEEGGLSRIGYNDFAKARYSRLSLEQASAIFSWGSEDNDTLKHI